MQYRSPARADTLAHPAARAALWSAMILLVAAVLATVLVLVGLASQQRAEPAPPPTPPMEISQPGGHSMAL
jgi:hypothetical protein